MFKTLLLISVGSAIIPEPASIILCVCEGEYLCLCLIVVSVISSREYTNGMSISVLTTSVFLLLFDIDVSGCE